LSEIIRGNLAFHTVSRPCANPAASHMKEKGRRFLDITRISINIESNRILPGAIDEFDEWWKLFISRSIIHEIRAHFDQKYGQDAGRLESVDGVALRYSQRSH
jgi:hypothetical protein